MNDSITYLDLDVHTPTIVPQRSSGGSILPLMDQSNRALMQSDPAFEIQTTFSINESGVLEIEKR